MKQTKKTRKPGGGRKPIPNELKKTMVRVWLRANEIEILGGLEAVSQELEEYCKKKLVKYLENNN
jgi:hypothetical protein